MTPPLHFPPAAPAEPPAGPDAVHAVECERPVPPARARRAEGAAFLQVTNAGAVAKGARPSLALVGPWTYEERRVKHTFQWPTPGQVRYRYNRSFHFVERACPPGAGFADRCSIPRDSVITTLNIPLIGVLQTLAEGAGSPQAAEALIAGFNNWARQERREELFIRKTVDEIVFGYDDGLIGLITLLSNIAAQLGVPLDFDVPGRYQLQANNSAATRDNWTAVGTSGAALARYSEWAGHRGSLAVWKGCDAASNAWANMINGTEGLQFAPGVTTATRLDVYTEDLLRSSPLLFNSTSSLRDVPLLRFVIDPRSFQSAADWPPNCAFGDNGPSGVLNLTDAVGAPVFASKPFWLDADPFYRTNITLPQPPPGYGTLDRPDRAMCDTFLDIEPVTGTVFTAAQRLQINVRARPYAGVSLAETLGWFYLPVMLANEEAIVPPDVTDEFQQLVGSAFAAADIVHDVGQPIAAAILAVLLAVLLARHRRAAAERLAAEEPPPAPLGAAALNSGA